MAEAAFCQSLQMLCKEGAETHARDRCQLLGVTVETETAVSLCKGHCSSTSVSTVLVCQSCGQLLAGAAH